MAGVKGRSGRKTRYSEVKDGNLLNVCTVWLIENFPTFDKETKIKVALEIAKKGVIQRLEHSGSIGVHAKSLLDAVEEAETKAVNRLTVVSQN